MRRLVVGLIGLSLVGCKSTSQCLSGTDVCEPCGPAVACAPAPQVEVQQKEVHVVAPRPKVVVRRPAAETGQPFSAPGGPTLAQTQAIQQTVQQNVMLVPQVTYAPYVLAQQTQLRTLALQGAQANQVITQVGGQQVAANTRGFVANQMAAGIGAEQADQVHINLRGAQQNSIAQPGTVPPSSDDTLKAFQEVKAVLDQYQQIILKQQQQIEN